MQSFWEVPPTAMGSSSFSARPQRVRNMLGILLVICQSFGASSDDSSKVLRIALVICIFFRNSSEDFQEILEIALIHIGLYPIYFRNSSGIFRNSSST